MTYNVSSVDPMTDEPIDFDNRRRFPRVGLVVSGRYRLADGAECACQTIDVSPIGFAIHAPRVGQVGDQIVAHIRDLGRLEGWIARREAGALAFEIRAPLRKIERLAERIAFIVKRQALGSGDRREFGRVEPSHRKTILRTADGREFVAEVIDASIAGAAVCVDVTLSTGAHVTLGDKPAFVLRRFPGGIAVVFDHTVPQSAAIKFQSRVDRFEDDANRIATRALEFA